MPRNLEWILSSAPLLAVPLLPMVGDIEQHVMLHTICSETPSKLQVARSAPCYGKVQSAEQNGWWFFGWLVGWLVGWLGFLLLVFPHSWDRVVPFRQYCGPWNERNSFKLASRLDLHSYSTGLIYVNRFSDASEYRQTPISVRDCRAKRCLWETCDAYVCYFRK